MAEDSIIIDLVSYVSYIAIIINIILIYYVIKRFKKKSINAEIYTRNNNKAEKIDGYLREIRSLTDDNNLKQRIISNLKEDIKEYDMNSKKALDYDRLADIIISNGIEDSYIAELIPDILKRKDNIIKNIFGEFELIRENSKDHTRIIHKKINEYYAFFLKYQKFIPFIIKNPNLIYVYNLEFPDHEEDEDLLLFKIQIDIRSCMVYDRNNKLILHIETVDGILEIVEYSDEFIDLFELMKQTYISLQNYLRSLLNKRSASFEQIKDILTSESVPNIN